MIRKVVIKNYKQFEDFELELNDTLNIIVGDNEAGKSTIMEAIYLVLTKKLNGKLLEYELSPYLFNAQVTQKFVSDLQTGTTTDLPSILIELYLSDEPEYAHYKGTMNSCKEDSVGMKLEVVFDEEYTEDYQELISEPEKVSLIPTEFYKINWYSFSNNPIHPKKRLVNPSYIDATTIQLQSGTDYYLQDIIRNELDVKERIGLNIAYRGLKEVFSKESSIIGINQKLSSRKGTITEKDLTISLDISQKTNWENNLIPHLDSLPFQLIGKGEQSALKIMLALERKADEASIILVEEPENHLSFSSLNKLISKISDKCSDKQILVTTHDAFVLNKLGLNSLVLLNAHNTAKLSNLDEETQKYFKILSGYDTLRLVLAKQAILVEGPSDELIVQRAYKDKYGKLPIEDGIDVLNVRGLSFKRFLDIAFLLKKTTSVVTDNDGDYEINVKNKYADYLVEGSTIKIFSSVDDTLSTLEPNIVNVNDVDVLNEILGTTYSTKEEIQDYMLIHKTEVALKIFESEKIINFPEYVNQAISKE